MKFSILAVGSQGDVRPSAALGAGLAAAGHQVRLVTLGAFKGLAADCGLDFAEVGIDPYAFIKGDIGQSWMNSMDKPWRLVAGVSRAAGAVLETLNNDSLAACRGSDVLLYNVPLSISGHTIAEALGIPGIPNAVAPYHPTRAFPSIITPSLPLQGSIPNLVSGAAALEVLWLMFRSHMNRWRKSRPGLRKLGLGNPLGRMSKQGIPWLYGFSPSVVPAPTDWPETAAVCGYWFTPPEKGWLPPAGLVDFLASGPPPVYVGFGSMVGSDPEQTMTIVLEAISKARVRAIFASGWGGIRHAALPDSVFPLESVPHDWLFPQCAAAVHHGGAGTTAATLRAGIPSVVVPYFYDQFFWGKRLRDLGVGARPISQKQLSSESLAAAVREVVGTPDIVHGARQIAESIARENGVRTAVNVLERYLGAMMRRITQ